MLAERGVIVSYESIRRRCKKFGPAYARRIKTHLGPRGDEWHMDEMVINILGVFHDQMERQINNVVPLLN